MAILLAGLSACATPAPPASQPGPAPSVTPSASSSGSPEAGLQLQQTHDGTVALRVAAQASTDGIKPLTEYKLPAGLAIAKVKVVAASLDGRDLDPKALSLDLDAKGNLVFYMAKSAFEDAFAGKAQTQSKSLHSSPLFEKKTQEVRTRLLTQNQGSLRAANETVIPEPDFLKAEVRGATLSRQMVGSLKKDAGKLAKEGVFIDRNFYAVLSVGNDRFSVQQATGQTSTQTTGPLICKFTLLGTEIETLVDLLHETLAPGRLFSLPAIAEKLASGDPAFLAPLADLASLRRTIEIEEIEEMLEYEIGPELTKAGTELRDIELSLDLATLEAIEQAHPELAQDALANAIEDSAESFGEILARAVTRADQVETAFESVGSKPISDRDLFDPELIERQAFTGFTYLIQSLAQPQQTPVPSASSSPGPTAAPTAGPSVVPTADVPVPEGSPTGSAFPVAVGSASVCPPAPCAAPAFATQSDDDCPLTD
ncbi:MAG TPA: hypothetical protein V6D23_00240 [Candidatus Obscuribacterales bacterium]